VIFSLTLVVFLMISFVSASIFSDFWNFIRGKNSRSEINFSPDICYGYASAYFNETMQIQNTWNKNNCNNVLQTAPSLSYLNENSLEACGDYACALKYYKKNGNDIISECAPLLFEDGFFENNECSDWCPKELSYVWNETSGACEKINWMEIINFSDLFECGNGELEIGENCDGTNLNNRTCLNFGFNYGELECSNFCVYIFSGCFNDYLNDTINETIGDINNTCGNGVCEFYEDATSCGFDCYTYNYTSGICGDGVLDFYEYCDDGNTLSGDGCDTFCYIEYNSLQYNGTYDDGNSTINYDFYDINNDSQDGIDEPGNVVNYYENDTNYYDVNLTRNPIIGDSDVIKKNKLFCRIMSSLTLGIYNYDECLRKVEI